MFSEKSFGAAPEGGGFAFDIWPELSNRNLTTQFLSSHTSLSEAENRFFFLDTNPLYGPTDFPFRSIAAAAGEIQKVAVSRVNALDQGPGAAGALPLSEAESVRIAHCLGGCPTGAPWA